eukprot:9335453-Alexandrium_andersonii.AAC.1
MAGSGKGVPDGPPRCGLGLHAEMADLQNQACSALGIVDANDAHQGVGAMRHPGCCEARHLVALCVREASPAGLLELDLGFHDGW